MLLQQIIPQNKIAIFPANEQIQYTGAGSDAIITPNPFEMKIEMSRYEIAKRSKRITETENQLSLFISPFFFAASSDLWECRWFFFASDPLASQYFSCTILSIEIYHECRMLLFIIPFDDS